MKLILLSIAALALIALAFYGCNSRQKTVQPEPLQNPLSYEVFLNNTLVKQLNQQYPEHKFVLDGDTVHSASGISIVTKIFNHRKYEDSESFQINFYTTHKLLETYVEERLSGLGANDTGALQYGVQSFLGGQFPVIVSALDLRHSPEMDFDVIGGDNKTHWHPLAGDILQQGALSKIQDSTVHEKTYKLIKPLLVEKLKTSGHDFHWFRYYVAKMPNGEIAGDCYYDNEPYNEALEVLKEYASTWPTTGFAGQKQFIMLRNCRQ